MRWCQWALIVWERSWFEYLPFWESLTWETSLRVHTELHSTVLYFTILYYTILYYAILYYPILYYTILFYACTCAIIDYCVLYYIVYYHPSRTELECYVLAQIIIVHSLFTKPFSTIFCGCTWKYFSLCFALSQLVPPYPIITCPTLSYHNLSHLILS